MTNTKYTFTVIRYVHDNAAGEALNVGVLVCAAESAYIDARFELRFERLSRTFAGFDGDSYRQALARFLDAVKRLRMSLTPSTLPEMRLRDASGVVRYIWPDSGLSFQAGPSVAGVTRQPLGKILSELFDRMVSSQMPGRGDLERRSDDEVWAFYQASLRRAKISHLLAPRTFTGPEFEMKFDHAFQNKLWHIVQPVTMDFQKAESLQDKATKWLGNATALKGHPQLGRLHLLLGEPRLEAHRPAYEKAKSLLKKMPVNHEIIEERDADAFAENLASFMREHGLASDENK